MVTKPLLSDKYDASTVQSKSMVLYHSITYVKSHSEHSPSVAGLPIQAALGEFEDDLNELDQDIDNVRNALNNVNNGLRG